MATTNTIAEHTQSAPPAQAAALLISLSPLAPESFEQVLATIAEAFPSQSLIVATPDGQSGTHNGIEVVAYSPAAPSNGAWVLTAADFLNAHELAAKHQSSAILQLGGEAQTLTPQALRKLTQAVLAEHNDLALACYDLPPSAGLVNSAILYPVTRALFGAHIRYPLAIDLCLSPRMAERLAATAQKFTAANQPEALLWPVAEASVAGYKVVEAEAGPRTLPQPTTADLNSLLALVTASLFTDVDSKAAHWQRARTAPPYPSSAHADTNPFTADEVQPMLESFRLAYGNLHEIWSLVLPPQSLLGLKRLSVLPSTSFRMPDSLWARIVYDFLLAFRLRTINRGHLLGALTPLYLAWVASHILQCAAGTDPEQHIAAVAAAFEADKPYLVSRWRWPDRFNP